MYMLRVLGFWTMVVVQTVLILVILNVLLRIGYWAYQGVGLTAPSHDQEEAAAYKAYVDAHPDCAHRIVIHPALSNKDLSEQFSLWSSQQRHCRKPI